MIEKTSHMTASPFMTAAERVFEGLRRRVLSGALRSGDRLVPATIAKEYGVSSMPVRDALKMLETYGLAEGRPGLGYRVVSLTQERYDGLRYLRRAVECETTRLCAARITPRQAAELEELAETIDALEPHPPDEPGREKAERDFHTRIGEIAGYPELTETIERVLSIIATYAEHERSLPQDRHLDVSREIASGDPDRAEASMRRHLSLRGE